MVPDIIRGFTATIQAIEMYTQSLKPHWTDVDTLAKPEAERRQVPEVEELKDTLKEGLERILGAFAEYLVDMDISRAEVQEAKKLVAKQETVQVR